MSALRAALVRQFRQPTGLLGRLAGLIMARRASNRERNRWTLDLLDLQPGDRVLELGCGPGYALGLAARRVPQGVVTGVDHSATMIEMARRRNGGHVAAGKVVLQVADDAFLEGREGQLDALFSANAVQFLDDQPRFFRRALSALRPGGRIATTYQPRGANPHPSQASEMAERLVDLMEDAGFADIRTERLESQAMPAICVLGHHPEAPSLPPVNEQTAAGDGPIYPK